MKQRIRIWAALALLLVMLSAMLTAGAAVKTENGLMVELTSDKEFYTSEENVQALLNVTNVSQEDISVAYELIPPVKLAAENTKGVLTLAAGEKASLSFELMQLIMAEDGAEEIPATGDSFPLEIVGILLAVSAAVLFVLRPKKQIVSMLLVVVLLAQIAVPVAALAEPVVVRDYPEAAYQVEANGAISEEAHLQQLGAKRLAASGVISSEDVFEVTHDVIVNNELMTLRVVFGNDAMAINAAVMGADAVPAPTNVKVAYAVATPLTNTDVRLWWQSAGNCTGYYIYRSAAKEGPFMLAGSSTGLSFVDTEHNGYYKVRAYTVDANDAVSVGAASAVVGMTDPFDIITQPYDVAIPVGQTATVKVEAIGKGLTYQWYYAENGVSTFSKSSLTGSTYSTTMRSEISGRRVYCEVKDASGRIRKSDVVTMTAASGTVSIVEQPKSVCCAMGETVTLKVVAVGSGLKYQWFYAAPGSSVFNASTVITNVYTTTMSDAANGRRVYCVVTDVNGNSVKSDVAILGNGKALTIIQQLEDVIAPAGTPVTLRAHAEGEGLTYQWYYAAPGSSVFYASSVKQPTYSTTMAASMSGRRVYCLVTDKFGNTAKTNTATLKVGTPLVITQQPQNTSAADGAPISVTVKATGSGLSYKWYWAAPGSTLYYESTIVTNTYSTTMNAGVNGRTVYCVITDASGNKVTSDTVTLSMGSALRITSQPKDVTAAVNSSVAFTVVAEGTGLKYQWYYAAPGSSTFYASTVKEATYTTTLTASNSGRRVYCVVTDADGNSVTSDIASMTIAAGLRIVTQPKSVTAAVNTPISFTVVAEGSGLTYQWYYAAPGSSVFYASTVKSATYTSTLTEANSGRQVYCVITDDKGHTVKSDVVTMTVGGALRIISQPKDVTAAAGSKVSFTVVAEGVGLTYQWYYAPAGSSSFNASTIKEATYTTTLTKDNSGRQVYCVVKDASGNTVKSDVVTMTVTAALKITSQPKNVVAAAGTKVSFTVAAEGSGLTYQWYYAAKGSSTFYASTIKEATYSTTLTEANSGRQVYCIVKDGSGNTVKSDIATMTVGGTLKITSQPKSVTAAVGTKVSFTVVAQGTGLTYQWYYAAAGSNTFYPSTVKEATYSTTLTKDNSGRQVYCIVKDASGNTVKSNVVTMTAAAIPTALKITSQPQNVVAPTGTKVSFTVVAEGDGLTYQWYYAPAGSASYNASTIREATYSTTLTIANSGRQVYCIVADKYGNTVKSNTVTMTAVEPVKIISQPESVLAPAGSSISFTVRAEGEGLTYQWYYAPAGSDNFNASTITEPTYTTVLNAANNGRQVYCIVKDKYGNTAQSNIVTMTVSVPLVITQQPQDVCVPEGSPVTITVKAEGLGLTYQWYYAAPGTDVFYASSTVQSATYSTLMSDASNGRRVYCVITDQFGNSITTNTVTITRAQELRIVEQPANVSGFEGDPVHITVKAEGMGLSYQWHYAAPGSDVFYASSSMTTDTYSTTMSQAANGRRVYCVVSDQFGNSVQSETVSITMLTALAILEQPQDVAVAENATATVTIKAQGDGLTYEWYYSFPGQDQFYLSSVTTNVYTTTVSSAVDGRRVYCVVTDKRGESLTSNTVMLSIQRPFTFEIANGVCTITGYTGTASAVTVPNTIQGAAVTTIAANAFANNTTIVSIRLPNAITNIADGTFEMCTNLTTVEVPNSVTNIGKRAFYGCTKLTTMTPFN